MSRGKINLTENESRLKRDWLRLIKNLLPDDGWEHNQIDNNAEAHLLAGKLYLKKGDAFRNSKNKVQC